jgi:hypothetical protein
LVTVYRTLDILSELGLICEVHSGGNCRSYLMRRPQEHHHHLICADCGTVADFTDCDLSELEQRLSLETGFEIKGHWSSRATAVTARIYTYLRCFNRFFAGRRYLNAIYQMDPRYTAYLINYCISNTGYLVPGRG